MKERPILFSGAMVRALLRDQNPKTQTRRVVTPQPVEQAGWVGGAYWERSPARGVKPADQWCIRDMVQFCPYGQQGDRLYVRETFFAYGRWETRFSEKKGRDEWHFVDMTIDTGREYRFDGGLPNAKRDSVTPTWWKRPAIHMPRAASRILLDVTGARVERLQNISEVDARAEGVTIEERHKVGYCVGADRPPSIRAYRELWDSLNAERGYGWDANPWVWVVEFKRVAL